MKNLLKSTKFQIGFTLIELLIAVAIIIILISIGAVSYSTVSRNSRDAQRKSDLKKVQLALEQFYADNHAYPDEATHDYLTCSTTAPDASPASQLLVDNLKRIWGTQFSCTINGNTNAYLNLPQDPIGTSWIPYGGFVYEVYESLQNPPNLPGWCNNGVGGNCQKYTLWAKMENLQDPDRYQVGKDALCDTVKQSGSDNGALPNSSNYVWVCVSSNPSN